MLEIPRHANHAYTVVRRFLSGLENSKGCAIRHPPCSMAEANPDQVGALLSGKRRQALSDDQMDGTAGGNHERACAGEDRSSPATRSMCEGASSSRAGEVRKAGDVLEAGRPRATGKPRCAGFTLAAGDKSGTARRKNAASCSHEPPIEAGRRLGVRAPLQLQGDKTVAGRVVLSKRGPGKIATAVRPRCPGGSAGFNAQGAPAGGKTFKRASGAAVGEPCCSSMTSSTHTTRRSSSRQVTADSNTRWVAFPDGTGARSRRCLHPTFKRSHVELTG